MTLPTGGLTQYLEIWADRRVPAELGQESQASSCLSNGIIPVLAGSGDCWWDSLSAFHHFAGGGV